MTAEPQVMFVVEYPCDRFCRIELDLSGERDDVTLRRIREKADDLHQGAHEPALTETDEPTVDQPAAGRPPATVFLSAPARNAERRH